MGTHPIFESDLDCLTECSPHAKLSQVRNSSGKLKELGIRLKSIRNIEKITKTMKMISSAKFAKASKTIGPARAFGEGAQAIGADSTEGAEKELYVAVTSDRGLCGALHTTICREIEAEMNESAAAEKKLVTYGDKGRAYFQSKNTEYMLLEFKEAGRNDPSFEDASFIAQEIQATGYDFDNDQVLSDYAQFNMTALIFALIKE